LGATPPTVGTLLFKKCADSDYKTITIKVPNVSVYTSFGTPWSNKVNVVNPSSYWDDQGTHQSTLTVALVG
jgi:hypothetical protein